MDEDSVINKLDIGDGPVVLNDKPLYLRPRINQLPDTNHYIKWGGISLDGVEIKGNKGGVLKTASADVLKWDDNTVQIDGNVTANTGTFTSSPPKGVTRTWVIDRSWSTPLPNNTSSIISFQPKGTSNGGSCFLRITVTGYLGSDMPGFSDSWSYCVRSDGGTTQHSLNGDSSFRQFYYLHSGRFTLTATVQSNIATLYMQSNASVGNITYKLDLLIGGNTSWEIKLN